jgi:indole-3-glycerol phosphate synthase/phosphoribosylanthranilate isomerase
MANELCHDAVQVHGQEDETYIAQLRGALTKDCMIWKALSIDVDTASEEELPALVRAADDPLWKLTDKLLLDCKVGRNSGGTGQQFNWTLLSQIPHKQQIILAGGITPSNATEAVAAGVSMLDVNSGIEDAPGIKNSDKLDMLFSSLRAY